MADSDSNRAAIEAFAAHFDPPLEVVTTERIDGKPVAAAYMCARHLPEHEVGVTAICWGKGYFRAWIEATGTREGADLLGDAFATCLGSVAQDIENELFLEPIGGIDRSRQPYWKNAKGSDPAAVSEKQVLPQLDTSNHAVSAHPEPLQPPSEQEITEFQCDHDFRPNPVGTRSTCWKCGAQSPKVQDAPEEPAKET